MLATLRWKTSKLCLGRTRTMDPPSPSPIRSLRGGSWWAQTFFPRGAPSVPQRFQAPAGDLPPPLTAWGGSLGRGTQRCSDARPCKRLATSRTSPSQTRASPALEDGEGSEWSQKSPSIKQDTQGHRRPEGSVRASCRLPADQRSPPPSPHPQILSLSFPLPTFFSFSQLTPI